MYLEFTRSQSFETFVRCHMHAFEAMGGIARELWFDNLATAVAEHEGNLVRFNPRFLGFARECSFVPRACHVAAVRLSFDGNRYCVPPRYVGRKLTVKAAAF